MYQGNHGNRHLLLRPEEYLKSSDNRFLY